ncbi:type II toxin-antitoxin system VapC family toxin [Anabaena azotica]|uniref:PIN domain-containing protein n=1 Tax=Anabaena azotica FACHB-119 TaxID=947527 RepID=A0ABR8DHX7_9NOST|nr:PIN domain-containing protein [Anabaena azotica]MBD2505373.1 PIN domain-containing protein [Anabaena azotica FACHB-119]
MKVIVDTSVWSLALRRNTPQQALPVVQRLRELIADDQVVLLGAVRQEVLSGIRSSEQFTRLKDSLRAFPDLPLTTEDYELAAEFYNTCRTNGIQGANTDFLLCAVAHRRSWYILTTDQDFRNFQAYIRVNLLD